MSADRQSLLALAGNDPDVRAILQLAWDLADSNPQPDQLAPMLAHCCNPEAAVDTMSLPWPCARLADYVNEWRTCPEVERHLWGVEIVAGVFTARRGVLPCRNCLDNGVALDLLPARKSKETVDCAKCESVRLAAFGLPSLVGARHHLTAVQA